MGQRQHNSSRNCARRGAECSLTKQEARRCATACLREGNRVVLKGSGQRGVGQGLQQVL